MEGELSWMMYVQLADCEVFSIVSIAYGVHLFCIVLIVLHNDQTEYLSFKVWSESIYTVYVLYCSFVVCACVSMTVAIHSIKSDTFMSMREAVRT